MSAALNIPVDRRIAVTGEISLHGGVKPVGGIQQKADGAIRDGCRLKTLKDSLLRTGSILKKA